MLAYLLALIVGVGSLGLYFSAFLFQEVHRKYDFLWSGIGMFYALVLWVCADRITGGLLLGQTASVSLLGWFGWQMMQMRWEQLPLAQRPTSTESFNAALRDRAQQLQFNLRNSSWRSSSLNQLSQLADRSISLLIALFEWGTALIGTSVKSWEDPAAPESSDIPPQAIPPQDSAPHNNQNPL